MKISGINGNGNNLIVTICKGITGVFLSCSVLFGLYLMYDYHKDKETDSVVSHSGVIPNIISGVPETIKEKVRHKKRFLLGVNYNINTDNTYSLLMGKEVFSLFDRRVFFNVSISSNVEDFSKTSYGVGMFVTL